MAKQRSSLFRISGTIGDVTFVQTKKGTYLRGRRGSKKTAKCNDTLISVYERNSVLSPPAKLVNDFVKAYAPGFKKGGLWQDLLGRLRQCPNDVFISLLQHLQGVEVNPKYPLSRISPAAAAEVVHGQGTITLKVQNRFVAFDEVLAADSLYFEFPVIFADEEGKPIEVVMVHTGWLPLAKDMEVYETSFEHPVTAKYCVVLMKVQAGNKGKEIEDNRAMGIRVMKVCAL